MSLVKPMVGWWYARKNKKIGPIETVELERLVRVGKIGAHTYVWHEGMDNWLPIAAVAEFAHVKLVQPPPLQTKLNASPVTNSMAGRTTRFFARFFDLWWETLFMALLVGIALGRFSPANVGWINQPGAIQVFGLVCVPIALVFDALLYRAAGNTPGKSLLGLQVVASKGSPLSLAEYLTRNLSLWVKGLALGLPLISLFTLIIQWRQLGKGLPTTYDERPKFRVLAVPIPGWRKIVFVWFFASLVLLTAVLHIVQQSNQPDAHSEIQQRYLWENRHTGLNTTIDSRWRNSLQPISLDHQIHMFSEQSEHSVVMFARELAGGYNLDNYVHMFRQATSQTLHFANTGQYFVRDGRQGWRGAGTIRTHKTDDRLSVEIMQYGAVFWRIVTIQAGPFGDSDDSVAQLSADLWRTVH
ncbi:RDD family protein [Pseudomonas sp. NPDC098747]|uniref:RDD family protein n=1 Tax=Pseudomonas sp. NPDC098747 TaxID=3364487 RepID=UPI00383ABF00